LCCAEQHQSLISAEEAERLTGILASFPTPEAEDLQLLAGEQELGTLVYSCEIAGCLRTQFDTLPCIFIELTGNMFYSSKNRQSALFFAADISAAKPQLASIVEVGCLRLFWVLQTHLRNWDIRSAKL